MQLISKRLWVLAGIAVLTLSLVVTVYAAGYVAFEAESGVESSATVLEDSNASNGSAVRFETATTELVAPSAPYATTEVGALSGEHTAYTGNTTLTDANITTLPQENFTINHPLTGQSATIPVRVIRGKTITSSMRFQLTGGATVLFDDCQITMPGGGYHAMYIEYGPGDAWITDDIMSPRVIFNRCTWDTPDKNWINGVLGHSYWVLNSESRNFQNAFDVGGMSVFHRNNIYGGTIAPDAHTDGIQFYGGTQVSIVENWIDIEDNVGETGAINFSTDFGNVNNSSIVANTLKGGTYTLYMDHTITGVLSDITVKDNVWVQNSWMYGPVVNDNVVNLTWINNTSTTGAVISP